MYTAHHHPAAVQPKERKILVNKNNKIDRYEHYKGDQEPITDSEVIAERNAKKNISLSRSFSEDQIVVEEKPKIKSILKKPPRPQEDYDEEEEYEHIEQVVDLNQIMESLTMMDNSVVQPPVTMNEQQQPEETNKEEQKTTKSPPVPPPKDNLTEERRSLNTAEKEQRRRKKQLWPPFGFIKSLYNNIKDEVYKEEAYSYINPSPPPPPKPTMSFSTPIQAAPRTIITPVLSPDNDSSLYTNSTITTPMSISPFEAMHDEDLQLGYWAVRLPRENPSFWATPANAIIYDWIELNKENQRRIMKHFKSLTSLFGAARFNEYLEFCDTHFYQGMLPIAIAPLQKTCFVPLDTSGNQIARLPLAYIPRR